MTLNSCNFFDALRLSINKVLDQELMNDASFLFCLALMFGWCKKYMKLQGNTIATR